MWGNTLLAQVPPKNINASDGTYQKYVLVRWDAASQTSLYKVYRGTSETPSKLKEVSNDWQKSTALYDYGVLPGVEYYYRIVSGHAEKESAYSEADMGFIKGGEAIAANFSPNTYLEPLVNSLRSDGYTFSLTTPVADTMFTAPLDSTFVFSGSFTAADYDISTVINVSVFSNQDEAYVNEEVLSKQVLSINKSADNYTFNTTLAMPDGSGLYYIVLTLAEDDEPIFVEKFRIE